MKILAIEKEKPGLSADDFKPYLKSEAQYVWEMQQKGIIREIYFNQLHNAVLVLECDNLSAAKELLNNFPLVKNGLIIFELMELNPYSGFERLFNQI